MATQVAHPRGTPDDRELARLAASGDGDAFAALYDRHEQRVYGFCMRMLSTPHDAADATQETFVRMLARLPSLQGRDLHFVAYTLATARNVCYDMIRARRTVEPVAEEPQPRVPRAGHVEEDPERFALLASARAEVRAANAALPARQREVLALREVELLSYDEIGALMDLNRNAVAQLVSRARIKLGELLRGSALASVGASSPACERALPLLASVQDEQACDPPSELDWVRAHLGGCETCRLNLAAMQEAGASYRAIGLLAPAVWLRHATIARAAEFVGADWSQVATSAPGAHASGTNRPAPGTNQPAPGASSPPAGLPPPGSPPGPPGSVGQNAAGRSGRSHADIGVGMWSAWTTRRRLTLTLIAGALLALGVVLVAMAGDTRDAHLPSRPAVAPVATAHTVTGAATSTRRPNREAAGATLTKPLSPGLDPAIHPHTTSLSAKSTPQDPANPHPAAHHRRRRAQSHRPAPAKPTPQPSAPTTTPTTTTPVTTTPTTTTPATPPPVSTPTTTPTTTTTTTSTPTTTTTESPPPTTPTNPGGGLIP